MPTVLRQAIMTIFFVALSLAILSRIPRVWAMLIPRGA